ncbi:MAG: hypothetical protein EPO30_01270 [Lysobacteraceae bacterium]|nr:MAG: hypothetical protein EPO30_01270 [Xanthomonadaceae bacterium]
MKPVLKILLALSAAMLLGACATPGYGGYGDRYGGYGDPYGGRSGYPSDPYYPGGYGSQYGSQRFVATVDSVDPRYGRVLLSVRDSRSYGARRVEVFYDNGTRLYYQGRQYPVAGLERGDEVSVDAVESNGRLWARQIVVVRNVREYGGGYRY